MELVGNQDNRKFLAELNKKKKTGQIWPALSGLWALNCKFETCNAWKKNRQKDLLISKRLSLLRVLYMYKIIKFCIKLEMKVIVLRFTTYYQSDKGSCCHSWLSALHQRLAYMYSLWIKSHMNVIILEIYSLRLETQSRCVATKMLQLGRVVYCCLEAEIRV